MRVGYCDRWKVRKMCSRNVMPEFKMTDMEK